MSQLVYLGSLLAALLLGAVCSRPLRPVPRRAFQWMTAAALYLLVFSMGLRIGRTEELVGNFDQIAVQALLYATATVAGTIAVLLPLFRIFGRRPRRERQSDALNLTEGAQRRQADRTPQPPGSFRGLELKGLADPLRLLAVLTAGVLTGRFVPLLPSLRAEALITWILYGLLFLIGITLARSDLRLRQLADHSLWILPVGTVAGTLAAGGALAVVLGQRVGSGLALAAGFGWYSLSGALLIELDGATLGATAFLANMFREALALLLIPLLARTRHPYIAIGVAGATSMDVTLPLIEHSCGPRSVPFAVASGALLSTAVPVLVPLVYSLA